ncbi:flagellar hook-associated protein 1 FlgK [Desulfonatronum thiosulfatophilum]|uniref:Flagellar hook-associated protein 1 n=1 Tax=Desulfonatronum thiosulfatophilum TaxID=617002 RepID=A0A1G6DIG5_9BACT|nr:flagellar hook-associated protein FlgK [Desulfonatronum thiosulfatophilum]SDB44889.1 flagellar hook-associated protein 1 FlgK [Desulfonatronum thiosulfatophilum]
MTVGVNSLLNTGRGALLAFQSAIHVTGENIANVNTPGYSRRTVRLQENPSIDYRPGQIGTGVSAAEVIRHYDYFIERQYLEKSSTMHRWDSLNTNLRNVEMLFNESIGDGLNDVMAKFWADWQNLSLRPDDMASRSQLMNTSRNMTQIINQVDRDLTNFQNQVDDFIRQDVMRANELLRDISEINRQIAVHDIPGQNNANALMDKRDTMVRELAGLLDIKTQDKGNGQFFIMTTAGHTLVDGREFFELKFEGPKSYSSLTAASPFVGKNINFAGSSEREYLIKVVTPGEVGNTTTPAQYQVSLDGGKSWLKDADGAVITFNAQPAANKEKIEGLEIWFDAGELAVGDKFTIVPKSGLYWHQNTSSEMNITPQIHFNGADNERRLVGGTLAGYFNFRDDYIGQFREKLNSLAETVAWEVNRIHSQGAGLQKFSEVLGTHGASKHDEPLSSLSSGLFHGQKLQTGNLIVWLYDAAGNPIPSQLGFAGGTSPPNFDPEVHTLEHVRAAFNSVSGITAAIVDNRLQLTADANRSFAFGSDSTGLLAALGINTFFDGTDARGLSINEQVFNNLNFINAGHVNGAGEVNTGDNATALGVAAMQYTKVDFKTSFEGSTSQTISNYYNSLVGNVGAASSNANFNFNYHKALADDLYNRQEAVSGVNLDEEMSSLIKFQHSYSAAAKLISAADQMFQTILSMK